MIHALKKRLKIIRSYETSKTVNLAKSMQI